MNWRLIFAVGNSEKLICRFHPRVFWGKKDQYSTNLLLQTDPSAIATVSRMILAVPKIIIIYLSSTMALMSSHIFVQRI